MPWVPGGASILALAVAGGSLLLGVVVRRRRNERYTAGFVALVAVLAGWTFCYDIQLGFDTRGAQLGWWQLTLAISGFMPTAWLLFALNYAGKDAWLTDAARLAMIFEPVLFAMFVITNSQHQLLWSGLSLPPDAPVRAFSPEFAMGYYFHIAYAYAIVCFGVYLLLRTAARSSDLYRRQAAMLLTAVTVPFAAHVSFTLGSSPVPGLDLTPFTFGFAVALISVSLFRFDLLDRTPIAREAAFDVVGNGLVVLDAEEIVVDADERAQRVLTPAPTPGDHVSTIFPNTSFSRLSGATVEGEPAGGRRSYEVQVSELRDAEDQLTGYALVLRDVTDRWAYEQRLEVANRVLRHNLRNDMNVVQGLAERIESGETDDSEMVAAQIRAKVNGVVETSEKVRQMTRIEPSLDQTTAPVDLSELAVDVLARFDCGDAATLDCAFSTNVIAAVANEAALATALRNLLENAVEHNDSAEPSVRLTTGVDGETAYLVVADDGPGIPAEEQEVLRRETETPLKHSQGLGLWLASWSARAAGGELCIAETGPDGSTVRVELPVTSRN